MRLDEPITPEHYTAAAGTPAGDTGQTHRKDSMTVMVRNSFGLVINCYTSGMTDYLYATKRVPTSFYLCDGKDGHRFYHALVKV